MTSKISNEIKENSDNRAGISSAKIDDVTEANKEDVLGTSSAMVDYSTEENKNDVPEVVYRVVLMRCGEAESKGNFCGWYDYDLSETGKQSMIQASISLKKGNYVFDHVYCSMMSRSEQSASIILNELDLDNVPITKSWYLNGRHMGALTGMNKAELCAKYGTEQVKYWLTCNNYLLPEMDDSHRYYNSIYDNEMYKECSDLPTSETLEMVQERVVNYWDKEICPKILSGEKIIIVSHNRTLQALIQHLDDLDYSEFAQVCLPAAMPFYYKFDEKLKPILTKHDLLV